MLVGFRAELAGRSIVYSADTCFNPEVLDQLEERGILSAERKASLCSDCSVQPADLLLHEAGVPPTHTPISALAALPESIRRNVRLIHMSDERAAGSGFAKVRPGLEHTICIDAEPPRHAEAKQILQILQVTGRAKTLLRSRPGAPSEPRL
jgi:phosphoribosyl 1,2-cyclic phosphodiesterase